MMQMILVLPAMLSAFVLGATYNRTPASELRVEKISDSEIDAAALTIQGAFGRCINGLSFQQDALTSYGGYQYVGYYDAARRVCLARRYLPDGGWEVIRFPDHDFRSDDAHNTISVGLCPKDGTIHLSFDHHGHPVRSSGRTDTCRWPYCRRWPAK